MLEIIKVNEFFDNGTDSNYKSYKFDIGKTKWSVVVVAGKFNYVAVKKATPWMSPGKEYKTMDKAVNSYKNPTLKMILRLIETM